MLQLTERMQAAVEHHRAGRLREAEALYRQVLVHEPRHRDAHYLLGVAALTLGRADEAVEHLREATRLAPHEAGGYRDLGRALRAANQAELAEQALCKAITLDPKLVEAHNDLADLLQVQGLYDEAARQFEIALALRPDLAELHFNLGNCHRAAGKLIEAGDCYRRALELRPQLAIAHERLGSTLAARGLHAEALASLRHAVERDPTSADAHRALGSEWFHLDRLAEAESSYRRALELRGDDPRALFGLGLVELRGERYPQAERSFAAVIRLVPNHAEAYFRQGQALHSLDRFDEAIACFRRAIALDGSRAEYHYWLGQSHLLIGELAAARDDVDRVLAIAPEDAAAHVFRGTLLLAAGEFGEGWHELDYRMRQPDALARPERGALWDGSPLDDGVLLVECERGLGDCLHFIRYASLLAHCCRRVLVEVRPPLVELLRESGFPDVYAEGEPLPRFDKRIPLMSVPGAVGTTLESIPCAVPYLRANRERVEAWRERLAEVRGFRVGIFWQGNPTFVGDRHRSIPPAQFQALADVPGVTLVSLQKDLPGEPLAALGGRVVVYDNLDAGEAAFLDTAAMIENLDLVVTSDSAVAHLAGGLGAPVWLLLSTVCDWRWLLARDDSPWYPTMRLFRQTRLGDWGGVFARVAVELRGCAASAPESWSRARHSR